jgi:hypothetical protein
LLPAQSGKLGYNVVGTTPTPLEGDSDNWREWELIWKRVIIGLLVAVIVGFVLFRNPQPQQQTTRAVYACAVTHYPQRGGCATAPETVSLGYTHYNFRETDPTAVTPQEVQSVAERLLRFTQTRFVFLNDWGEVQPHQDAVQVVNNLAIDGALYTVFLPVGWIPTGSYPVVLSGNGAGSSNNRTLYKPGIPGMARLVALSTRDGGTGLIWAMSNAGGRESMGIDEATYRSVGAFFNWITQEAGGDPERFVTAGGSRGGGTALMWAINPLGLDYQVKAVFASSAPTAFGSLAERSPMTWPSLERLKTLTLQEPELVMRETSVWLLQHYHLWLENLLGYGTVYRANLASPIGMAERLRGMDILLDHGTHDPFFPYDLFIAFDQRLTELDIPHGTLISLGQGHAQPLSAWQEYQNYVLALARNQDYALPIGRNFWLSLSPGMPSPDDMALNEFLQRLEYHPLPPDVLPFSVEIPYAVQAGTLMEISVCGAVSASYTLTATHTDDETVSLSLTGIIPDAECQIHQISAPSTLGAYNWYFVYQERIIPNTNTPQRDKNGCATMPAITSVLAERPTLEQRVPFIPAVAWGIDQFVAQVEGCVSPG